MMWSNNVDGLSAVFFFFYFEKGLIVSYQKKINERYFASRLIHILFINLSMDGGALKHFAWIRAPS